MSASVTDSFTGTANGTPVLVKDGILEISGTFAGTIQLHVDALGNGTYAAAADSSGAALSITGPVSMRISNGVACNVRSVCSAYTSGTAVVSIRNS
jgi:hypothetical protein